MAKPDYDFDDDDDEEAEPSQYKRVVWNNPKLVKLKAGAKFPQRCPDHLVYWNKCETRIESQRLVTAKQVLDFQKK